MTHASSRIKALRSVSLQVPDLTLALKFFHDVWNLYSVSQIDGKVFLAGSGNDAFLISLLERPGPAKVVDVTLRAHDLKNLDEIKASLPENNGKLLKDTHSVNEPGLGQAITVCDADGRIFKIIHGDQPRAFDPALESNEKLKDIPIRLAHTVLNSDKVDDSQKFMENVFDFCLSDRTKIMAFMRCNDDHHSIAFGDTDNNALNHIAFLMPDLESVMRGGGRLKDNGYPIAWGPGRHGPGNNAFNYFVGPFDLVVEYTSEVQQIDDSYKARYPKDWQWPAGRTDHWGISAPPSDDLKRAQKLIGFINQ